MATTAAELLDTTMPFPEMLPLSLEQLFEGAGEDEKGNKCEIDLI